MVAEQAPTPKAQAKTEQMPSSEQQPMQDNNKAVQIAEQTDTEQTSAEQVATEPHPDNDIDQSDQTTQPEQPVAMKVLSESLSKNPRFFTGVMFFVWVFSTLVFLSVTAGYMATR